MHDILIEAVLLDVAHYPNNHRPVRTLIDGDLFVERIAVGKVVPGKRAVDNGHQLRLWLILIVEAATQKWDVHQSECLWTCRILIGRGLDLVRRGTAAFNIHRPRAGGSRGKWRTRYYRRGCNSWQPSRTFSSSRSKKIFASAGLLYLVKFSGTFRVRTRSPLKPASTRCSLIKLRIIKPAPINNTKLTATCPITNRLRSPCRPLFTVEEMLPSFRAPTRFTRRESAGMLPNINPVSTATSSVNSKTGPLMLTSAVRVVKRAVIWSDPQRTWREFDAVVVRSCWDYHLRLHEFLGWIARLEHNGVAVLNSPDLIRWNAVLGYPRIGSSHFPRFVFVAGSHAADIQPTCKPLQPPRSVCTIETHTANERVQALR